MAASQPAIPEPLRKMTLILAIVTTSILGIIVITVTYYYIWKTNLNNKIFQKYESFSQKIMPQNFRLVETREVPGFIDTHTHVEQIFDVSSTRKEVIEQLEPIYNRYGFKTFKDNTTASSNRYNLSESATISQPDYIEQSWHLGNSKTGIWIRFLPEDTLTHPLPYPHKVEAIVVWWSCYDDLQACAEDKDLSI